MQQFYLMVLAVVAGILIVRVFTGVFDLVWLVVVRGLKKWAAS